MQKESAQTQPTRPQTRSDAWGCSRLSAGLVAVLTLALAAVCLFAAWVLIQVTLGPYEGRIYPNVTVLDIDLGGLTPEEARLALEQAVDSAVGTVVLQANGRRWMIGATEMGMQLDVEATVQAAFNVGRGDQSWETLKAIWGGRHDVAPVLVMDPATARQALEAFAPSVYEPPVEATLRLEGGQVVAVPGRPGRRIDVDTTLARLVAAITDPRSPNEVDVAFYTVAPRVADASATQAEAETLLTRQLIISTYDVLTEESFTWNLGREEIVRWLRVEQTETGTGLRLVLDEAAVSETLAECAAEMGAGRGFRLEEATAKVVSTFEAGGGTAALYMTHPTRSYTVQDGDRLTTIAAQFGVPPGIIAEANPGVDLNWLQVGQQIVIPSQDVLTPHLTDPNRRIVISIPEQRMRVYEDGQLLYEWPVSTGLETSPTYPGVFQVLDKEENAYGSQWDLWMPHFIAIYRAGADVYNGIHALPTLSSGQRLWEGALGSPASYGCIILGLEEAETLYNWADIGVLVVIE